jgi:DNA-3-methyladenine glycosylase
MNVLDRKFYERDTLRVARALLGKRLVRRINGLELSGMIAETEASG